MNYIRTAEAITALETRDRVLSAKQRQLLILIGSKDFNKLSDTAKEAMCSSEVFNSLIDLGFLTHNNHDAVSTPEPQKSSEIKEQDTLTPSKQTKTPITPHVQSEPTIHNEAPVTIQVQPEESHEQYQQIELTFDNMKQLLIATLSQHCGLMGKTHAKKIENAQTVAELKRSHMTVITLLQESRMSQAELLQFTKALQRFYQHIH
ncbi:hypothetical protein [Acinetobacter rathckeae]|uniref:hypothetical protein n=1 Tax=Acinetobacter rathckeae TaxID=2605272 RepID=UPI0018A2A942|nr:hypothetical protein [Acinetobacter rathckeae]MBF7688432.1 hypothetical protein [Acinetobacter rathckeae]